MNLNLFTDMSLLLTAIIDMIVLILPSLGVTNHIELAMTGMK